MVKSSSLGRDKQLGYTLSAIIGKKVVTPDLSHRLCVLSAKFTSSHLDEVWAISNIQQVLEWYLDEDLYEI